MVDMIFLIIQLVLLAIALIFIAKGIIKLYKFYRIDFVLSVLTGKDFTKKNYNESGKN